MPVPPPYKRKVRTHGDSHGRRTTREREELWLSFDNWWRGCLAKKAFFGVDAVERVDYRVGADGALWVSGQSLWKVFINDSGAVCSRTLFNALLKNFVPGCEKKSYKVTTKVPRGGSTLESTRVFYALQAYLDRDMRDVV